MKNVLKDVGLKIRDFHFIFESFESKLNQTYHLLCTGRSGKQKSLMKKNISHLIHKFSNKVRKKKKLLDEFTRSKNIIMILYLKNLEGGNFLQLSIERKFKFYFRRLNNCTVTQSQLRLHKVFQFLFTAPHKFS